MDEQNNEEMNRIMREKERERKRERKREKERDIYIERDTWNQTTENIYTRFYILSPHYK